MKFTIYTDGGTEYEIESVKYGCVKYPGGLSLGFDIIYAILLIAAYRFSFVIKGQSGTLYEIVDIKIRCKCHVQVFLSYTGIQVGESADNKVISGGNSHVH